MKVLLSSTVYGKIFAKLFLEHQLKSLLDNSNLPTLDDGFEFVIFTDNETMPIIQKHPNFMKLSSLCTPEIRDFTWRPNVDRDLLRYSLITQTAVQTIKEALEKKMLCMPLVADLVFAQDFFPRVMERIAAGHDSVFVLPFRATAEGMENSLKSYIGAPPASDLFKMGYKNINPVWRSCFWQSPFFTEMPFCLLWNTRNGIIARSFSLTPIIFRPTEKMALTKKVIDIEIPGMCSNPYWATDWTDAPVMGVEPVMSHWPAYRTDRGPGMWIRDFMGGHVHETARGFLRRTLYYPSKEVAMDSNEAAVCEAEAEAISNLLLVGES